MVVDAPPNVTDYVGSVRRSPNQHEMAADA